MFCYVGGLVAEMAANAWLSVIAKKGAVVVYPRTIRCQQWNDTFGMGFFFKYDGFLFFFPRPTDPNFSLKNPSNNFSNRYGLSAARRVGLATRD